MAGLQGGANLAVGLEAANAGAVPGARIDHDKGALARVDLNPLGWNDAGQAIVDRPLQLGAEHDELGLKAQDMRCNLSQMLLVLVAALAHDIGVEQATLPEVDGVFVGRGDNVARLRHWPIKRLLEIHVYLWWLMPSSLCRDRLLKAVLSRPALRPRAIAGAFRSSRLHVVQGKIRIRIL